MKLAASVAVAMQSFGKLGVNMADVVSYGRIQMRMVGNLSGILPIDSINNVDLMETHRGN